MMDLDAIDRRILTELQADARISNAALAEAVGLSPSPCLRRVRALEAAGVIRRYAALLEPAEVGLPISVFVQVTLERQIDRALETFETAIQDRPEVMECYLMTGDADYLLRVVVSDLTGLRAVPEGAPDPGERGRQHQVELRAQSGEVLDGAAVVRGVEKERVAATASKRTAAYFPSTSVTQAARVWRSFSEARRLAVQLGSSGFSVLVRGNVGHHRKTLLADFRKRRPEMPDECHNFGDIQLATAGLVNHDDVQHRIAIRVVTFRRFDGDRMQAVELLHQDFPDDPGRPVRSAPLRIDHFPSPASP